jgi:hypothetical protein
MSTVFFRFKIFYNLLLLSHLGKSINIRGWIIGLLKIILLFNIPLLIFQFLYPEAYSFMLGGGEHGGGHIQIGGQIYQRGMGFFEHPSRLAIFTCFSIFIFLQLRMKKIWIILASIQLFIYIPK